MSAPSVDFRHTKYLDYGFMAARVEKAAQHALDGTLLSDEDRASLRTGSDFLRQVAQGARALTTGDYQVQNLTGAMEALDFAIDPLEQLGDLLSQEDLAKVLQDAADAVTGSADRNDSGQLTTMERDNLVFCRDFFDQFYNFVREQIDNASSENLLGDSARFEVNNTRFIH